MGWTLTLCTRTFCDTTMYLYVSEIFPTEIRPIGMGFSLFGQFACEFLASVSSLPNTIY